MSKRKPRPKKIAPKPVDMESLVETRGTWTLDPDALQRLAEKVVATVISLAAEAGDDIAIKVGHVDVGSVHCTTRYAHEEVEAMIAEDRRAR